MDSEALKLGKEAVRQMLIQPLTARGLQRAAGATVAAHEATMEALAARLAYMTADNLRALAEVVEMPAARDRRKPEAGDCRAGGAGPAAGKGAAMTRPDERHQPLSGEAAQFLADLAAAPRQVLPTKGRAAAARDLVDRGLASVAPGKKVALSKAGAWAAGRMGQ